MARLKVLTQTKTTVLDRRKLTNAGIFALAGKFRLRKDRGKFDIEHALLNYN